MLVILFSALCFFIVLEIFLEFVYRKLADWLILPLIIIGLLSNIALSIYQGENVLIAGGYSIIGFILGLILCALPNVFKGVLEGDAKFFTFIGTFLGPKFLLWTALYSFILGSIPAILYFVYRKIFKIPDSLKKKIPFGFVILIALIIVAYLEGIFISS